MVYSLARVSSEVNCGVKYLDIIITLEVTYQPCFQLDLMGFAVKVAGSEATFLVAAGSSLGATLIIIFPTRTKLKNYQPMSDEFDEEQFWPSKWSKRLPADTICAKHYEVAHEETKANKRTILSEENVAYGQSSTELMDIYGKHLPSDAPWFVYLHGGYWVEYTKDSSAYCALPLWKAGIRVCVPDYDLAPKVTMTQIVGQMRTMAEVILSRAVAGGSRGVWISGHSAGAHLAARLLDETWLKTLNLEQKRMFRGLILISGIYDLKPILKLDEVNNLLKMDNEEAEAQSPINTVTNFKKRSLTNQRFKTIIIVAENDSDTFKQQSSNYCKILNEVGMEAEYVVLSEMDHFDVVENLKTDSYALTKRVIREIVESK